VSFNAVVSALRLRGRGSGAADDEAAIRSSYLDGLRHPAQLAGFLTGSIDLVFRHRANGHRRWFIVDYKSNRLDPHRQGRFPIAHFCREGMRYEMEQHHYYLQYHLYLLALHRYLRWRLGSDYEPERDIGGVYYLFFRGMIGASTPREGDFCYGAFFDRPPTQVIEALDRLFNEPAAARLGGRR
jgi:exodeoxyribonuclease V beta subunit